MKSKEIQKLIDRVVGTDGTLRIPSWWMHKILSDLVKYCKENASTSVTIVDYIESQLNLVGEAIGALDTRLKNVESHELFEIINELPTEPKDNTIYLVPSVNGEGNNVLTEWAYINGTFEQFGEFKADIDLTSYLKIEDSPFEKGDAENSAILKGGNNQVISEGGVALGKNNIAGLKGWYYKAVQRGNDNKSVYLYLTTKQQTPIIVSTASSVENQEKTIEVNLSKGDICSIINGDKQIDNFEFRLNEMSSYGRISFTYKGTGSNPLYTIKDVEELKLEDYSIFCISKPNEGLVELSKYNIALGNNTKSLLETSVSIGLRSIAAGITSYAEGQDTIAIGECSHAEGAFTKSKGIASHTEGFNTQTEALSAHAEGYNTLATGGASHAEGSATKATGLHSHSEGDTTEALGNQSHAEGKQTIAEGHQSHAEGFGTSADGEASHAEGMYTLAGNQAEHAEGMYNKSNSKTIHSVGIGTSNKDRKNAHEITQDGKHYIFGVNGYDGTNPTSKNDLATYITTLETRIKELEDIIEQITEKV